MGIMGLQYRPEIDGLRALAVLPVLFFHAGFSGFSGGFVGVDIFFVISGFLITNILLKENQDGRYSTLNFYERRARRLIPAFLLVLIATFFAGFILLPSAPFAALGEQLLASTALGSNYYFLNTLNYFAPAAEEMPLLHIWSLSLEEQFYIGFPIALSLTYALFKRYNPRVLFYGICWVAAGLSLTYMLLLHNKTYYDIAFFSLFSRAWELIAGGLIAFHRPHPGGSKAVKEWVSAVGLGLLFTAIIFITPDTHWPNILTLLPVLGTLLLIGFCDQQTLVGRFLSWRPLLMIGVISYSLYLWHQPIFALLRVSTIGTPSLLAFTAATGLAIILSWISYHIVEQPFRDKSRVSRRGIFTLSITGLLFIGALGAITVFSNGAPQRYADDTQIYTIPKQPDRRCIQKGRDTDPSFKDCLRNQSLAEWAVLGDSHSNELAIALAERLPALGVQQLSFSGCGPALHFESYVSGCHDFTKKAVQHIMDTPNIKHVILSYRHSLHVRGELHENSHPDAHRNRRVIDMLHTEKHFNAVSDRYWDSFYDIAQQLKAAGKDVWILSPIPELPDDIRYLLSPRTIFHRSPRINPEKAVDRASYQERHQWWFDRSEQLSDISYLIDTWSLLCEEDFCSALTISGKPAYYDDDHVTRETIKPVVLDILERTD